MKRVGGGEPEINERDDKFPGIAALREHAVRSGDELIEIAPRRTPEEAHESGYQNERLMLHSWGVLIQALHHGNDHRTHVCTILGHNGLTYGGLDGGAYCQANGVRV